MKKLTVKEKHFLEQYKAAVERGCKGLYDVYKNPSVYKEYAWRSFCRRAEVDDAKNITVVTHNSQYFACAYECIRYGVHMVRYFTPYHNIYEIPLDVA